MTKARARAILGLVGIFGFAIYIRSLIFCAGSGCGVGVPFGALHLLISILGSAIVIVGGVVALALLIAEATE